MSERLSHENGALAATACILLSGTLACAPIALTLDGVPHLHLSAATWGSVVAMGLICTMLTFLLWNWGSDRVSTARAGVFLNLEPLVGALLGVASWRESLGIGLVIGGCLILGAAVYVSGSERSGFRADALETLDVDLARMAAAVLGKPFPFEDLRHLRDHGWMPAEEDIAVIRIRLEAPPSIDDMVAPEPLHPADMAGPQNRFLLRPIDGRNIGDIMTDVLERQEF
jgi:hypothetical protein